LRSSSSFFLDLKVLLLEFSREHVAAVLGGELAVLHGDDLEEVVDVCLGVAVAEASQRRPNAFKKYKITYIINYLFVGLEFASEQVLAVFGGHFAALNGNKVVQVLHVGLVVLVPERGERGLKALTVDKTLGVGEGLEGGDDNFVLIGGSTLLTLAEHVDELGEVDVGLAVGDHAVDLLVGQGDSDVVGGRPDVATADHAVLVPVHELEALLELGNLLLGELIEDV